MSLESVLCYKMSCGNPTLLSNSSVVQPVSRTPRIVGLSAENLYSTKNVCFLRMIQTTLGQHGICRARSFKEKHENFLLEDCVLDSLESPKASEDHQRSLESYLNKVESETEQHSKNISQLKSLHTYLGSLNRDTRTTKKQLAHPTRETADRRMKSFVSPRRNRKANVSSEPDNEESSNLYIVSTLASIDIAVFLFEVASPVKNSDYNLYSLPLLYGAKVNGLILVGEWWRLLTPMFLVQLTSRTRFVVPFRFCHAHTGSSTTGVNHMVVYTTPYRSFSFDKTKLCCVVFVFQHSGIFHVALSSWVLLDFGPRVCKAYGSFTFFFMCLLGGISGNLLSFLHTPEATVGGSGPIFAIIGAWLIYQLQNRNMVPKQVSEKMFQKAVIATTLSFGLANFGLIDSWTYLGAAVTGISYGYLTCPIMQLDDLLSKVSRDEGIAMAKKYSNPYKSLGVFVLFVLAFSSMLYLMDPPLDLPQLEGLLEMPQLENLLEMVE